MSVLRTALLVALGAALAACADAEPPAGEPERNEAADTARAGNDGITAGGWQFAAADGGDRLVGFRSPNGELLFAIACDVRGGLLFERHGLVPRANLGQMQLRTGGDVRRLAATTVADDEPQVQARAPYNDQLIPALMRFEEPLEVRIEGLDTLMLPPSPEVRELTRMCQRGSRAPGGTVPPPPAEAP